MATTPNPKRVAAGRENRKKWRGLTPEGRKRLSEATRANKPWLHSTGPKTMEGKAKAALNGKSRQKGAMSIRELRRATIAVENQIQDIRRLLKDVKATKQQVAMRTIPPLVEQALELLTDEVNLSTGLSHPNDLNKAKELLIRLHDADESLQEVSITAWARKHGWLDEDARELGELAAHIDSGGKVRNSDGPWWPHSILKGVDEGALLKV